MAYAQLKSDIASVIRNNGNQEITGNVLQGALLEMINALGANYQYAGVADTSTTITTTEANVFYLLTEAGIYANMSSSIVHTSGIGIAIWDGSAWSYQNVPSSSVVATDATPTENSTKPVQSGGVYKELNGDGLITGFVPQMSIYGPATSLSGRYSADWATTEKIPVEYGDIIKVVFNRVGEGSRNICVLFDEDDNMINAYSSSGYTNVRDNMEVNRETCTYIRCCVDYTNLSQGAIYKNGKQVWAAYQDSGIKNRITNAEEDIETISGKIENETLADSRQYLPTEDLVKGYLSSGQPNTTGTVANYSACTYSMLCVPKSGTWHIHLPFGIQMKVSEFNSVGGGHIEQGPFYYDANLVIDTKKAYRLQFNCYGNASFPIDYINGLINDGYIQIYTDNNDNNVVVRNLHREDELQSLQRVLVSTLADNKADGLSIFAHISDMHGDIARLKNYMDFCESIKPVAAFNSGDAVLYNGETHFSTYQVEVAKEHTTDYLFCIGNHEAYPTGQTDLYAKHIQSLAERYAYLSSSGVTTTDCYYYKDYADAKIRIIAINYYDLGTYTGRLGQSQITWFCNTLQSTPTGYGILVMLHSPEDYIDAAEGLDAFYQKKVDDRPGLSVGNRIISRIIDAFISHTTISTTYTESNNDEVSVSADFSSIDSTTEFIAYICGHRHADSVGYYRNSTNKQLSLCITSGNALYGDSSNPAWANQEDLPRGGVGVSQDAFNLYTFDRVNGRVKIMRIGADITEDFTERKVMSIPYKD